MLMYACTLSLSPLRPLPLPSLYPSVLVAAPLATLIDVMFSPASVIRRSFQYDSGCPLRTSVGSMEGEFQMWVLSEADGEFKEQFDAKIERFKLSISEH